MTEKITEMFQQFTENPMTIYFIVFCLLIFLVTLLINRKVWGHVKSSDKASILNCSFTPSPLNYFPGKIFRMSDDMQAPAGMLKMTVGTSMSMYNKVPQLVDVKVLIIDENKNVIEASKQLSVRQDGMIGIINIPFPIKPYAKKLICRAWIVAAYYNDANTWINDNASAYEIKNKKYMARMVKKIK